MCSVFYWHSSYDVLGIKYYKSAPLNGKVLKNTDLMTDTQQKIKLKFV